MNYEFNAEELSLIAAFDSGNRSQTIELMDDMQRLLSSVKYRLAHMTDEEYAAIEPVPAEEDYT